MKKNTKYSYKPGQRFEVHGSREYDFGDKRLPSVTTILSRTKDQEFLTRWKNKVGHKEAERINELLQPVHKSLFIESNPSPVKYAAKLLNLCSDDVRLPLVKITNETKQAVEKALKSAKII